MEILSIRPAPPGGKTLARFDAELSPGIRAYDLKLVKGSTGHRVYGPSLYGGAAVTLAPAIADALSILALEAVAQNENID